MRPTELLFDRADRFSNRVAIVDQTGEHRYSELNRASKAVAGALLGDASDLAEARVAFLEAPGFRSPALQWGIWRAGGIAVPLATSHPARELEYILDDCRPAGVAAGPELGSRLEPLARSRGIRFALTSELVEGG